MLAHNTESKYSIALSQILFVVYSPSIRVLSVRIAEPFLQRFNSSAPLDDKAYAKRKSKIESDMQGVMDISSRRVMEKFIEVVDATYRTNV